MSTFWKSIYTPMSGVSDLLKPLAADISLEEWSQTVAELNNDSAAGPSHLPYRIIKKLPENFTHLLISFINFCYHHSLVPTAWKSSNIAPIPKPQSFNYNMENTRPIALLDTIRKTTTKILTNRLSSLLSRHHILKGFNFCGLKNEDTSIPLYALNNIIEDAKETGKELWLTT